MLFPDLEIHDMALDPEKGYQPELAAMSSQNEKEALLAVASSSVLYQSGRVEEGAFYALQAVALCPESLDGHIQMAKWGMDGAERRASFRELISVRRERRDPRRTGDTTF